MKKKCFLILALCFLFYYSYSQDTLTYKGLVLSQIDDFYRNTEGEDGKGVSFDERFSNFLVCVDSNLNYNNDISKGIFLIPFCMNQNIYFTESRKKYEWTKINGIKDLNSANAYVYEAIYLPTGKYWKSKNINNHDVQFYLMDCEFKYIFYGKVEFKTVNIKATTKYNAVIPYHTKAYFITEIISMKPIVEF